MCSFYIVIYNDVCFCCLKVQQPFDTASYYAQFYRPGPDSDGRVSPFVSPGVASKFNGNVTVLPPHSSQTMQEVSAAFWVSLICSIIHSTSVSEMLEHIDL